MTPHQWLLCDDLDTSALMEFTCKLCKCHVWEVDDVYEISLWLIHTTIPCPKTCEETQILLVHVE